MERHFIVFYFGSLNYGTVRGYMEFTTFDGHYLKKQMTLNKLKKANENLKDIIITNIIELNNKDFKDWND